ncbi:Rap1a/Tai family immunity protein [Sulfuricaulis sp.]|uniref:Rap1a/Tai family immunity protein n=1 Tax=Sulfuricaulis sp. TaxID=2003553 RepID=UPI0034A1D43D
MRPLLCFFLTAVLLSVTSPAFAQAYVNGNRLLELLESRDVASRNAAHGYIQGVVDAIWFTASAMSTPMLCLPDGVTPGQLAEIIQNHYRRFPERRHYGASGEIYGAINEKFRCTR